MLHSKLSSFYMMKRKKITKFMRKSRKPDINRHDAFMRV